MSITHYSLISDKNKPDKIDVQCTTIRYHLSKNVHCVMINAIIFPFLKTSPGRSGNSSKWSETQALHAPWWCFCVITTFPGLMHKFEFIQNKCSMFAEHIACTRLLFLIHVMAGSSMCMFTRFELLVSALEINYWESISGWYVDFSKRFSCIVELNIYVIHSFFGVFVFRYQRNSLELFSFILE